MAKGKKSDGTKNTWNVQFAQVSLDKAERTKFKTWYSENVADLETLWEDHLSRGYKMSVKWDNENDCYIVASTGTEDATHNVGLCLTSRSDVLAEAILLQVYKSNVMCKNGQWEVDDTRTTWG